MLSDGDDLARSPSGRRWVLDPEPGAWSRFLDRLAGPHELFLGRPESPHLLLGVVGIACAFVLLLGLVLWTGASTAMAVVVSVAAIATFAVSRLVRTWLATRGNHLVLEDLVLVLAVGATVAWSLGEPVLPYLDLLAPALGAFLVFARLGCLVSGCCHGRPARCGIRYRDDHAVPAPILGLRLFPVQLVEAVWIIIVTSVAAALVVARAAPGVALSFWILGYATGCFVLEFARGDVARPYFGPLSRVQWIALGLVTSRVFWEEMILSVPTLRLAAAGGAALLVVLGYVTRHTWLRLPRPLFAVADIRRWEAWAAMLVDNAQRAAGREVVSVTPTSGLTVALGIDPSGVGTWLHSYTVARDMAAIGSGEAFAMAGFVIQRLPTYDVIRAQICDRGRFHLWVLVHGGEPGSSAADDPRLVLYRAQAFARATARLCATEDSAGPPAPAASAAVSQPTAASSPAPIPPAPLPLGYHLATVLRGDHDER